jgi:hypothetical protein
VGLNAEAVRRLGEVRKMRSLLETHSALLALHSDESFQADAKLPRVLAAIEAVRLDPSKLKEYAPMNIANSPALPNLRDSSQTCR